MLVLYQPGWMAKVSAFLIFIIASLTDYWDGKLARKHNQVTALGQLLDPIADKVLTFTAFLSFVEMRILPAWMVLLMLVREVWLTGFRLLAANRGVVIPAGRGGKHKTILQFTGIILILIFLCFIETSFWKTEWTGGMILLLQAFMLVVFGVTLGTGIFYTARNWRNVFEK